MGLSLGQPLSYASTALALTKGGGVSYVTIPSYATGNFLGDSYTDPGALATPSGSTGNPSSNGWARLVATALGMTLTSKGVSGSVLSNTNDAGGSPRASNGRDRFALSSSTNTGGVLGANAKACIFVALGFNDARYIGAPSTFNAAAYKTDYREILNGLLTGGYAKQDVYLLSPWYITDTGLGTGSTGFSGQTRAGFEAFVAAASDVASEYGVQYCDVYAALNTPTFIADVDAQDNIHPGNAGHALISSAVLSRMTRPNTRAQPTVTASSGGTGLLSVTLGAVTGATSYTIEYGIDSSYAYPNTTTQAGTSLSLSGVSGGIYRVRARANFAGMSGPWAFSTTTVSVAGTGGSGGTALGQTENYAPTPDNTFLTATSPTLGTWTNLTGSAIRIFGGAIKGSGSVSTISTYTLASTTIGSGGVLGAFAEAALKVLTNTAGLLNTAVTARVADSNNLLSALYNGQNIRLLKRVGGVTTQIGSTHTVTLTGSSNVLRLEVGANTQSVYLNGTLIISGTEPDSNLTALGNGLGLFFQTGPSNTFDNTTGTVISSLTVGSLP